MHTFKVGDKEIPEYYRKNRPDHESFTTTPFNKKDLEGETVSHSGRLVIPGHKNGFFHALSDAFNCHFPVTLTPDAVWLCILNGLTHHIDQDPEGLRHHFVEHEGKKVLEIEVDSPSLPYVPDKIWEMGVKLFSGKLKEHIGKRHDLIVCGFTTTTYQDRLSSEITLMGAMKHYFEYKMSLACGLTEVTIKGDPGDWEDIKQRLGVFSEFDLKWWTDELIPIIDQFKAACAGDPDIDFWNRMFVKHRRGSGGQYGLEGWLCAFFPYLTNGKAMTRNKVVNWAGPGTIDPDDIPSGLVFAPVELNDHGKLYDFKFYGGIVGCTMDLDFTVEPVSGWAIQNLGRKEG